jgi:hypothetical protein
MERVMRWNAVKATKDQKVFASKTALAGGVGARVNAAHFFRCFYIRNLNSDTNIHMEIGRSFSRERCYYYAIGSYKALHVASMEPHRRLIESGA